MDVLIDIGNTSCKVAFCVNKKIQKVFRAEQDQILSLLPASVDTLVYSTVRDSDPFLEDKLKQKCRRYIDFNIDFVRSILLPNNKDRNELKVLKDMPDGMGADRMAAILAAHVQLPQKDIILFDFGTATTVEFIDGDGTYRGGAISLGLNTRYRALNHFTKKIPLLNPQDYLSDHDINDISTIGFDLDTALAAGNILGIMFEIEGYIAAHPSREVVLTGGDGEYFIQRLSKRGFLFKNLVLMGLALLTQYDVQNI